jgi:release factor glutamine methyltransferase
MSSDKALTVKDCLGRRDLPRLETGLLLAHVLSQSREWLLAHDDHVLSSVAVSEFFALENRRLQGEPIAYLVGQREFMSHSFAVGPEVLIPRPDTELLVEIALASIALKPAPAILDLGTGSGIIAISIAKARPDAQVTATDLSAQALVVARANAVRLNTSIETVLGKWFDPFPATPLFDLIVSNPPYIHPEDTHLDQGDLRFEPRAALTDEQDGLSAYKSIIFEATSRLKLGGELWVEHGFDQAEAIVQILAQARFTQIKTSQDLAGHPRVSGGSYNGSNF